MFWFVVVVFEIGDSKYHVVIEMFIFVTIVFDGNFINFITFIKSFILKLHLIRVDIAWRCVARLTVHWATGGR
jgi:hypothetical protein